MKALILAAGYATRLYPLTKEYPKPLLDVGGRPIIDYIVDKLNALEQIDEIMVVTNSKFIAKFKDWKEKLRLPKKITLIDDLTKELADRRGAIGDMAFSVDKKKIKDDLLVIGGDNLLDGDLGEFVAFAAKNKPSPLIGVYDIKEKEKAKNYGVIGLDAHNRMNNFQEKPQRPKSTLVAMCLYFFPKQQLKLIKEYISLKDGHDATGLYIQWLIEKIPVYGFVFDGRWYDIGKHQFYDEARESFKS